MSQDLTSKEKNWLAFMRRLKGEARNTLRNNSADGCAIVTAHILMDFNGTPLVWVVPEGKRIEPSSDAAQVIQRIAGELSGSGG